MNPSASTAPDVSPPLVREPLPGLARATGARSSAFWWLVWALLAALSVAVVAPAYVNHDAAWYLHMVRRWLDGATLYRDVVDTNPPLIVLLTVPPVWLASGTAAPALFKAYVFCLAFLSLGACALLVRRTWLRASSGLLISALLFVTLPFVRTDFGQREHLMVLMVLPYLLLALARACAAADASASRPPAETTLRIPVALAVAAGIAGGLGFAMKPHYLLGWLSVEALLLVRRPRGRSWQRPEAIAAVAALVLYALFILAFVPQYLGMADKARQVYGGLNSSAALLMRLPDTQVLAVAIVLLALVRLPRRASVSCLVLLAAAIGLFLGGLLQLKGWSYHMYPARAAMLLFFVIFAIGVVEGLPGLTGVLRGGARMVTAIVVAALLLSSVRYLLEARRPVDVELVTPLVATIREHAPAGPIAVLSMRTIIYPAFPAVSYTGAAWSMRHNSLWFLPGLYEKEMQSPDAANLFRAPAAMGSLERGFYEEVIGDLCGHPPALLLIEPAQPRAPAGRRALDLAAYYAQDARFAKLWQGYERLNTIGPFTVYQRTTNASCR